MCTAVLFCVKVVVVIIDDCSLVDLSQAVLGRVFVAPGQGLPGSHQ